MDHTPALLILLCLLAALLSTENGASGNPTLRQKKSELRDETPQLISATDRPTCAGESTDTPIRVDTTERVANLRAKMLEANVDAYIIPNSDAHQSEYVAEADKRRQFASGFSGSAGTAVITAVQQALWTDGRYFLQAEEELDCNWTLMKEGEAGVPTILEWLQTLPGGSKVGADPTVISAETWVNYANTLTASNIDMVEVTDNLVDMVWSNRPAYIQDSAFVHPTEYAGKSWTDKLSEVRESMAQEEADLLILTALDEIAWLLNLRGSDIPYNPVFRSYVTITPDSVTLFIPNNKVTDEVRQHLASSDETINIQDYDSIWFYLKNITPQKAMLPAPYSYSGGASYAVYSMIRNDARISVVSPVLLMKAQKNEVEIQGMKKAHIKDAVALCDFLSFLEEEIALNKEWTEISAAEKLSDCRSQQQGAMGDSFSTISGFGSNGAIIHYEPTVDTDTIITNSSLYLLDSGGQYLDGTTDVTRTMHYGKPTPFMIEAYTRVLIGHIELATAVFPEDMGDTKVDILARRPLYEVGLDYNHGTGHGIGMFLSVHEAPTQVRIYGTEDHPFKLGYFFSDEPGYYKDYDFGIRLESIMTVVKKETTYNTKPMLGFEAVTLAPFESKLIDTSLMNSEQCKWLDSYHAQIKEVVGTELLAQNRSAAYEWLTVKTQPLCMVQVSSSEMATVSLVTILVGMCIVILQSLF